MADRPISEDPALAEARREAKHRRRRLIYNNDGCDAFGDDADSPERFLAQRMEAVPGSQVDSVFYCTGATVMFTHDAKLGETYGKYPVTGDWGGEIGRNCAALIKQGRDTLALVTDFCHEHDLEVFFTHRINDIHDSMESGSFELATWKREHPEYCLGRQADQHRYDHADPQFWWSALNFELPEVRSYLLEIVEDICRRYDIDGYDVDYFRSPMFFAPNLDYQPATEEQTHILTNFQRRIREIIGEESGRRGRPLLASARVPMSVAACRHVGIDIRTWLEEDLLDVLITGGGYVPFSMPTRELVELGHRYDKPVYPTISNSGMNGRLGTIEAWRGAASNVWSNGADGIMLFNTFPEKSGHPHFDELGDPDALRAMDKVFAIDPQRQTEGDLAQGIVQDRVLPVEITAGSTAKAVLPVGDDLAGEAAAGRIERSVLHVCYEGLDDSDRISVRINGWPEAVTAVEEYEAETEGRKWILYAPDSSALRRGDNELEFESKGVTTRITDIELHVAYTEAR